MEALETVKMETMTVSDGENGNQTNAEIQGEVAGFAETTESALPIALGFDIGGSTTKIGLVNQAGEILNLQKYKTDIQRIGVKHFLDKLVARLDEMLKKSTQPVLGIGGTFCGWTDDTFSMPFLCGNAPLLHGLNLKKLVEDNFHLPAFMIDDTNAHALAEYRFGSGRGIRRFMSLAMGTGISSGVILDGKLLRFTGGCVGDTGHLILRPGGPRCSAGCLGCGEALIGVRGIERQALQLYGIPISAKTIIELSRSGDPAATWMVRRVGKLTGELLASLSHIFLPERIALTGGTAHAGETLLFAARQRFEELVGDYHRYYSSRSAGYYRGVEIVLGEVEGETGVIGAVVNAFEEIDHRERMKQ